MSEVTAGCAGMTSSGLPRLLTPAEAAVALKVNPKTLARWAREGKIPHIWTPGRTRRYREDDVQAIIRGQECAG